MQVGRQRADSLVIALKQASKTMEARSLVGGGRCHNGRWRGRCIHDRRKLPEGLVVRYSVPEVLNFEELSERVTTSDGVGPVGGRASQAQRMGRQDFGHQDGPMLGNPSEDVGP